jgi:hypothetical protein
VGEFLSMKEWERAIECLPVEGLFFTRDEFRALDEAEQLSSRDELICTKIETEIERRKAQESGSCSTATAAPQPASPESVPSAQ